MTRDAESGNVPSVPERGMKVLILPPAPVVSSSADPFPVCDPAELYRMWHPPPSAPVSSPISYPLVPVRRGKLFADKPEKIGPIPLHEVQFLLVRLRDRLRNVGNVKMTLALRLPHEPGTLLEQLMAIPFKNTLEGNERGRREWHKVLEITAGVLHLVGRRLAEEGEYRTAMECLTQAMTHYAHLDEAAYTGWIEGIGEDMDNIPPEERWSPSFAARKKGIAPWDLQRYFEAYQREFMTESGRYVFMNPACGKDPVFRSPSFPVQRAYLPEEGTLVSRRFQDVWRKMPLSRRFLLSRPLGRIRGSENRNAAGLLDTIAWRAARHRFDFNVALQWITKAIHALDTVLREDPEVAFARLVIDGHTFTYGGLLGHSDQFALWCDDIRLPKTAAGVEVYFLPVISP